MVVSDWFKIDFLQLLVLFLVDRRFIEVIPSQEIVVDLLLSRCIKLESDFLVHRTLVNHVEFWGIYGG